MSFASPQLLFLLVPALALTWYIGWPRLRFRRRRDLAALMLRSLLLTLVVLALAGLQVVRAVDRLSVVFLVDASDSMGVDLREAQVDYIREAITDKPVDDEWAVVVFGADVSIDTPFSNLSEANALRSEVLGNNTDIASAIQTAISLFPADARRRIVVLSDGQETIGNAEAKARLAEASGVEISYVPLLREAQPDVRIAELTSPAQVGEGQEFDITLRIESELDTPATLLLFNSGQLVHEQNVQLNAGTTRYSITQRSAESGFLNFTAQIVVPGGNDDFSQNNTLGTFSEVVGPPRILLVAAMPEDVVHLIPALEGAGILLDVATPAQLPADTSALAQYESIVIVNVPAADFTNAQMQRVDSYVKDLGGGLVFVGGPDSYGPGGYFQTPLEATLPIETQIRDQQRIPQLTIAYLVDSSGSMATSGDGVVTNLELAIRAVNLSIDFLQPSDRISVGTFDSSGAWVVPFQDVDDRRRVQALVGTLRPGGGTDIGSGIDLVERDIVAEPSERKHIILLTDGGASEGDLVFRTGRLLREQGVTLSVVAIGENPTGFLSRMAQAGDGRYHEVSSIGEIPRIYAQETVLATRSYIEEGAFRLVQSANNPILEGISALPALRGYVATQEKSTAQVILRGPEPFSDPMLASWQYGLGRSIAFMSDATSRWAEDWVTWDDFSRFWSQVVDFSITESAGNNIEARVQMGDDGRARIIVDARDDDGNFLNNLALQSAVVAPNATTGTNIRLLQTAPGRYEASFRPEDEGSYFLGINGGGILPDGENVTFNEVTGWVMSYSPEYAIRQPNERLLSDIAEVTGGASLADNPAAAFAITQEPRTAVAPIWPVLLVLALIVLLLDIAVRRIIITRRDLALLRQWVFRRGDDGGDARMSSLMSARERARQRTGQGERDESTLAALRRVKGGDDDDDTPDDPGIAPQTPTSPQPRRPRSGSPAPQRRITGDDSTVSNLLKRRRDNRDDE